MSKILQITADAMLAEEAAIEATKALIDGDSYEKAARMLIEADRIATCGCGHSGFACMHFAHSLCCIEQPARFIAPSEAIHGALGFLKKKDVMVFASRGGETDELYPIIDICRAKGASTIIVTENEKSRLALNTDIVLKISVIREADRDNCQGTSSFIATCCVFDALQALIIELANYSTKQFALIHPGGAVGKRLNEKETHPNEE